MYLTGPMTCYRKRHGLHKRNAFKSNACIQLHRGFVFQFKVLVKSITTFKVCDNNNSSINLNKEKWRWVDWPKCQSNDQQTVGFFFFNSLFLHSGCFFLPYYTVFGTDFDRQINEIILWANGPTTWCVLIIRKKF